jgi:hypothetical protein
MFRSIMKCVVVSAALGLAACSPGGATSDKRELAQEIGPNTYRNGDAGLTITAPEGWHIADNALTQKIKDIGREVTTSNMSAKERAAVTASMAKTATLFTFFKHTPGPDVQDNPAIMGVMENIGLQPGIKSGKDYFAQARKLLEQSSVPIKISDSYSTHRIGGQQFDRMDVKLGEPGLEVSQRYFAARHNNSVVLFVQTWKSSEDLATLDKVLASVKLDW